MPDPHPPSDRTPAERQADHDGLAPPVGVARAGAGREAERVGAGRARGPRGRLADPAPAAPGRRDAAPRARRAGHAPPSASGARRRRGRRAGPRPPPGHGRLGRRRTGDAGPHDRHLAGRRRLPAGRRRRRQRVRAGDRIAVVDLLGIAAGRRRRPSTACSSRSSPRPARPSSTARRSRSSSAVDRRRSPSTTADGADGDGDGDPAGRPEPMVTRVLIANRGEIALRILRACRTLGIEAVVAYSEADRDVAAGDARRRGDLHRAGRRAPLVPLGARDHLRGARHGLRRDPPGLRLPVRGRRLRRRGARPRAHVHRPVRAACSSGSPRRRRPAACSPQHGLPTIPGSGPAAATRPHALEEAERIGYPVLVKPSAGGGGKGMRMVRSPRELAAVLPICRSEARAAFGDDALYLERWLEDNRHVEIQVAVDRFGHGVHLWERDCSVQRRHQKILEESPSPAMTAAGPPGARRARDPGRRRRRLRERRHARVPRRQRRQRLLHRDQLPDPGRAPGDRDAHRHRPRRHSRSGSPPASRSGSPRRTSPQRGHAIEFRINAEDAEHDFRPGAGTIERFNAPGGPGVRFDSHVYAGLRGPAVLRLAARQAHRLGPDPRGGDRPRPRRPRRARHRRRHHQRADPPRAARLGAVPRGPVHDQPARPRRQRGVPRRRRRAREPRRPDPRAPAALHEASPRRRAARDTAAHPRLEPPVTDAATTADPPRPSSPLRAGEIEGLIPHRWPFLLVDRIVEYDPDAKRIVGIKAVTATEWFFQGHFPGLPVMPGVLQVEALAQTMAVYVAKQPGFGDRIGLFAGIDEVRFKRIVVPGRHAPARGHDGEARQPVRQGPRRRERRRRGRLRGPPVASSSRPPGSCDDADRRPVRRPRQPDGARGACPRRSAPSGRTRCSSPATSCSTARTRTATVDALRVLEAEGATDRRAATPTSPSATSTTGPPSRSTRTACPRRSPWPPSGPTTSWATSSSTGSAACPPERRMRAGDDAGARRPRVARLADPRLRPGARREHHLRARRRDRRAGDLRRPHARPRGPRPRLEGHRQRRLARATCSTATRPPRGRR